MTLEDVTDRLYQNVDYYHYSRRNNSDQRSQDFMALEDVTDRLFRNVGKEPPLRAA